MGKKNKNNKKEASLDDVKDLIEVVESTPDEVTEVPKEEAVIETVPDVVPEEKPKVVMTKPIPKKHAKADVTNAMLAEYAELCNKEIVTPKTQKAIITNFQSIVIYAINNTEPEVLEIIWQFFLKEKKGMLSPERAFIGIADIVPNVRMRIEMFWGAFTAVMANRVAKRPIKIDFNRVRDIIGQEIVTFLSGKNK